MIFNRETPTTPENDKELLVRLEKALQRASLLPYNNASNIYEAAGEIPNPSTGGSCLLKLREFQQMLPPQFNGKVEYITSVVGKTTHYAALVEYKGKQFYCDPFLWQRELMSITDGQSHTSTMQGIWNLQRMPDEEGSLFVISLNEQKSVDSSSSLVTHRFTDRLRSVPKSSAIPINYQLPSFMMQVPDFENQKFYRFWYLKQARQLGDIFVKDGVTGENKKVSFDPSQADLRQQVMIGIQSILNMSENEIIEFFSRAHDLEMMLEKTLPSIASDIPPENQE